VISAFLAGGAYPTAAECAPSAPVVPVASVNCTPQQLTWINANGQAGGVAAQELSLAGNTGEADILALSAVESFWGKWTTNPRVGPGFPGAWFGQHGPVPGQVSCTNFYRDGKVAGCVSIFASFAAAANAFVNTKGQLVIGQTNPQTFFTTLTSPQGGFAIGGSGMSTYLSVENGLDNCLNSLNGFNN
jgi:hypothetical protein